MGKLSLLTELIKKTFLFGPGIALGNVILTFGGRIMSGTMVKRLAYKRNKKIQKKLAPLVDKALSEYSSSLRQESIDNDRTIWVCWLQGEDKMPPIPALCLKNIRQNANGHKVQVITKDNIGQFVTLNPVIIKKYKEGKIKNCHFADILRVCLLSQRGGLWLDATLLCTAPIDDVFFDRDFYTIKLRPYGNFISQCRWAVYCLSAKRGNRLFALLEKLFTEYILSNDYFIDYFLFDHFIDMLYQRDEEIKIMIDSVEQSNPAIQRLSSLILSDYNRLEWASMTENTSIFKLNWRSVSEQQVLPAGPDSYYNKLCKGEI